MPAGPGISPVSRRVGAEKMGKPVAARKTFATGGLPRSIVMLGLVSLLMDVSSEMIHGLLPVFLVVVLGASKLTVGLIEGLGEATAAITKLFSGLISDRLGKRKVLVVLGYGLGTLSKPFFALAPTPVWVLGARFMDRVGKGIRGAPRDALIGDLAPTGMRGAAYGLRQSLDNVGAFLGPLLAMALMALSGDNFRLIFWLALIPGAGAVLVLVLFAREPAHVAPAATRARLDLHLLRRMGPLFCSVVAVGGVLTLARFSEAFLILRAEDRGLALALAPLVLVVINIVSSLSAYPVGLLADRMEKRQLLIAGFVVLMLADLVLMLGTDIWMIFAGVALWGLHLGLSQGLLAALVAETAPADLRASAFGVFNLVNGLMLLAASVLAGLLWQSAGAQVTFFAGALITGLGLVAFGAFGLHRRKGPQPGEKSN